MNKYIALVIFTLFLTSCKSKKNLAYSEADASLSVNRLIENYHNNKVDFQTLHIKGNAKYGIYNPTVDIRIRRGEEILVSVRMPLIGVIAKAKITPEYVSYYQKIDGEYFEGDYEFLNHLLGTELDYQKVENLLLGKTIEALQKEEFRFSVEQNRYRLTTIYSPLKKSYFFEPDNFRLEKQFLEQPYQNRNVLIRYADYKKYDESVLPHSIMLNVENQKDKNEIRIEYKSVEFDTNISFPYQIPRGYSEIIID
ncbi:MAG: DUF4292 domain-containing protein [Flavobacteriaceae bacterium]